MKWFNNPETLEDLKKQYKRLAMRHHPDLGGSTRDMQDINDEYERLFAQLKDTHKNAEGEFYTSRTATTETAAEFMDIIEKLIHMDGVDIEVCGSWLWVTGNTRAHKDELKALAFKWSSNKQAWYFHRDGYRKRGKKSLTLDEIREYYGSEKIEKESGSRIVAAWQIGRAGRLARFFCFSEKFFWMVSRMPEWFVIVLEGGATMTAREIYIKIDAALREGRPVYYTDGTVTRSIQKVELNVEDPVFRKTLDILADGGWGHVWIL